MISKKKKKKGNLYNYMRTDRFINNNMELIARCENQNILNRMKTFKSTFI